MRASQLTAPTADTSLVATYERFQQLCVRGYYVGYSAAQHDAIDSAMDAPDAILFSTDPTTPHEVEVLLRRIASIVESDRWFDRAIVHGDDETLRERLGELPGSAQVLARCILYLTAARQACEVLP